VVKFQGNWSKVRVNGTWRASTTKADGTCGGPMPDRWSKLLVKKLVKWTGQSEWSKQAVKIFR
jgi:hypothetical protein